MKICHCGEQHHLKSHNEVSLTSGLVQFSTECRNTKVKVIALANR